MTKTFDYAKEAEDCLEAAEKARNDDSRAFLLAMARVWANLAGADEPAPDPLTSPLRGSSQETGAPAGIAGHAGERRIT